ncbi:uncharacterized protein V1510DRAFT_430284 [Dipodascopsis tothii]|uniref:uncharacterized protein n=1 Tax=Dipodascopsis tothii TaxID=44089 RepID=UPI0034CFC9DD
MSQPGLFYDGAVAPFYDDDDASFSMLERAFAETAPFVSQVAPTDADAVLERLFADNQRPNAAVREALAGQTGLSPKHVQTWFQNRRAAVKVEKREQERQILQILSEAGPAADPLGDPLGPLRPLAAPVAVPMGLSLAAPAAGLTAPPAGPPLQPCMAEALLVGPPPGPPPTLAPAAPLVAPRPALAPALAVAARSLAPAPPTPGATAPATVSPGGPLRREPARTPKRKTSDSPVTPVRRQPSTDFGDALSKYKSPSEASYASLERSIRAAERAAREGSAPYDPYRVPVSVYPPSAYSSPSPLQPLPQSAPISPLATPAPFSPYYYGGYPLLVDGVCYAPMVSPPPDGLAMGPALHRTYSLPGDAAFASAPTTPVPTTPVPPVGFAPAARSASLPYVPGYHFASPGAPPVVFTEQPPLLASRRRRQPPPPVRLRRSQSVLSMSDYRPALRDGALLSGALTAQQSPALGPASAPFFVDPLALAAPAEWQDAAFAAADAPPGPMH